LSQGSNLLMSEDSLDVDAPIRAVGEQHLLHRLQRFCPAHLVGDDAAVLPIHPDHHLVVTADMLVDGVHFSVGLDKPEVYTTSLMDVGWRAAAANLSDLAAMGAAPLGITVSLGLPSTIPVRWLDELYDGMVACLSRYQTSIVGGDLCRSPILTVSIAAIGEVLPTHQILRSTAQVGDAIVVTGAHGASRAGLALLTHSDWGQDLSLEAKATLKQTHQRPIPRLDVPPLIRQIAPTARVAGMDSSDGLADAVLQICRASGVGACLWRDHLPIPAPLQQTQSLSESACLDWVLYGGEDFELVLCLPSDLAESLVSLLQGDAALIGQIIADQEVFLEDAHGQRLAQTFSLQQGFRHFEAP
jgi:thiamine-monophosphate kinase